MTTSPISPAATKLATNMALLNTAEVELRNIADRYGDELEVLAWMGALLERITCQGQEGAHD